MATWYISQRVILKKRKVGWLVTKREVITSHHQKTPFSIRKHRSVISFQFKTKRNVVFLSRLKRNGHFCNCVQNETKANRGPRRLRSVPISGWFTKQSQRSSNHKKAVIQGTRSVCNHILMKTPNKFSKPLFITETPLATSEAVTVARSSEQ